VKFPVIIESDEQMEVILRELASMAFAHHLARTSRLPGVEVAECIGFGVRYALERHVSRQSGETVS
jgi:hypothetical protein